MDIDLRGELQIGGAWVDATGKILKRQALTHRRGRQDQRDRVDPSTLRPLLNNTDGRFSPDNPNGEYYGKFGRNTPFRLSVRAGSPALEVLGNFGDNASTPDHASLDVTGDLDVRFDATLTTWAGESNLRELCGKYLVTGDQRSWVLFVWTNSTVVFRWSADGVNVTQYLSTEPIALTPSGRLAIRVTLDIDNGSGGHTATFYTAPTIAGPWTQLGAPVTGAGTTSVFASTADVNVGDVAALGFEGPAGRVHAFELRNGIDGTLVASPDFTAQAVGATSFVDSAGRTWTVNGAASITNRRTRLSHELAAYPTEWHPSGAHAWVDAQTAGILRRLRRGEHALDSTLRRRIPSFSPLAYWPCEEGENATQAYSPIAGVSPLSLAPANWAADDSLASSNPLPTINSSTSTPCLMNGRVPTPATALTAWHVQWVYRINTGPAVRRTFMRILGTGTIAEWYIQSGTDGTTILGKDADGTTLVSQGIATSTDLFGQWVRAEFKATQNGGNVDWNITWTDVGGTAGTFGTSFAGTVGRPTEVASPPNGFSSDLDGMAIGHISVWPSNSTAAYDGAIDAWTGETAGERMQRLADEETLPLTVSGVVAEQTLVGPQRPDAVLNLLEEAAEADGGILYEDREQPALRYRDRAGMYNQTPALVLDYNAPGLAPPLKPTGDDDATENDVTVTRVGGSSGRAFLEEGAMSVQAPPNGVGTGYDSSYPLNLHSDDQTEPHAYWRMHLGTYEGRRYPQVHVMVHQAPALADQILAVDVGDKIVIKNPPLWVAPGDIELIVQGYEETFNEFAWDITFNCTPGSPWNVAAVADPTLARVDANPGGSTLAAAATSSATELLVHTPSRGALTARPWITSTDRLSTNPDFEADLTGWGSSGATLARVPTPGPAPFSGAWSLEITPDGVSSLAYAFSSPVTVVPGTTYRPYGWLRSNVAGAADLNVNWYDGAGVYLSTSTVNHTLVADTWTEYAGAFAAPVGAATARVLPTLASTPPASRKLLADVVLLSTGATGEYAREFPYDIRFGGETARVLANSPAVLDTFGRTVAGGWGTANTGQAWTLVGAAADFAVGSGYGSVTQPATGIAHLTLIPAPGPDVDLYVDVATDQLAAGASLFGGPILRASSNADFYMARVDFTTAAGIALTLRKRVANVESQLAAYTSPLTHVAGTFYRVRFRAQGTALKAKIWLATAPEPGLWHAEATDSALTTAANLGTRSFSNTGSTAVNPQLRFDNVHLRTPQRMTVLRSLNSVIKAHGAGAEVRVANPARVAL
ncbi:hypothetical protein ABT063_24825 [Streptomyces sp. NPDC002838]|uniref:hypothetical protein n=1 Tax=Streptomyces sp. NPDC002838 TaxID=3154436 RepID=UPI0033332E1A